MELRHYINTIRDTKDELVRLKEQRLSTKDIGKIRSLDKSISMKLSKLHDYLNRLKNFGQGSIVCIHFKADNHIYKKTFVNVSANDVREYITFLSQLRGKTIEILELNEYST